MNKIKVMSEHLANKISAGEVVEKCASVVKELVENSIDAHSTSIKIELIDGGLTNIKIIDNGVGMEPEDAILAFERHATSKLLKEDDLYFINTLGFRGEALPSIAAVSKVDMKTNSNDIGTHIIIEGGKLILNENIGKNKGTTIEISNLFYNTPARLKYLKSEQYELSQSVQFIEKLALSKPDIEFELSNNNRTIIKTTGSNDLLKTIYEIYGLNVSTRMIEVKAMNDDFEIKGYICKPEILRSNRNDMNVFVNGRIIKNYDINKAINDAYYNYKPDKKYPIVVLNIETDPTLIDVNIHPTKQDIKISKYNDLYSLIINTIEELLNKNNLVQDAVLRLPESNIIKQELKVEEENEVYKILPNTLKKDIPIKEDIEIKQDVQTTFDFVEEKETKKDIKHLELIPIGQIHGTFIVAQNEDGMYLIDQHAAQERINYEKVKEDFKNKNIYTVNMLIPITIEYTPSDYLSLKENFDYLKELGFEINEFGLNTINIVSHPSWIKEENSEETIKTILEMIINEKTKIDRLKFEERLIQTTACKMSIKANTSMTLEEMENLLKELVKCKNPYNCAHGRPSIMNFNNYELDRMFKRVMN